MYLSVCRGSYDICDISPEFLSVSICKYDELIVSQFNCAYAVMRIIFYIMSLIGAGSSYIGAGMVWC